MDSRLRSSSERAGPGPAAEQARRPAVAAARHDQRPEAVERHALAQLMRAGPAAVIQRKALDGLFGAVGQLKAGPHEDDALQLKAHPEEEGLLQKKAGGAAEAAPASAAPNRTGLPDDLKAGIETLSGVSMDGVKVHYGSPAPAQLNALAFAQGQDIHLAPGQEQHLPHEAWHVVQQAQGRVQPTLQAKLGVAINDDAGLEHEADVMGARAMSAPAER